VSAGFWADNALWLARLFYSPALNSWEFAGYNPRTDLSVALQFEGVCLSLR
jgi:hypothetical protein